MMIFNALHLYHIHKKMAFEAFFSASKQELDPIEFRYPVSFDISMDQPTANVNVDSLMKLMRYTSQEKGLMPTAVRNQNLKKGTLGLKTKISFDSDGDFETQFIDQFKSPLEGKKVYDDVNGSFEGVVLPPLPISNCEQTDNDVRQFTFNGTLEETKSNPDISLYIKVLETTPKQCAVIPIIHKDNTDLNDFINRLYQVQATSMNSLLNQL